MATGQGYQIEQATPAEEYTSYLLRTLQEFLGWGEALTFSWLSGQEDLEAHRKMVSTGLKLYTALLPKIEGTPLAEKFSKWLVMRKDPTLFFEPEYSECIWAFQGHIMMAFEHLGITRLQ